MSPSKSFSFVRAKKSGKESEPVQVMTVPSQFPMNEPMLSVSDGTVVERISENLVLMVDKDDEEHVLRIGGPTVTTTFATGHHASSLGTSHHRSGISAGLSAGEAGSGDSVLEDDSPLFLRKEPVNLTRLLLGGESPVMVTVVPIRVMEAHASRGGFDGGGVFGGELGYLCITNFRVIFVPDSQLLDDGSSVEITEPIILRSIQPKMLSKCLYTFPLGYILWCKSQIIVPASDMSNASAPANAAAAESSSSSMSSNGKRIVNSLVMVSLVDGRLLSWEVKQNVLIVFLLMLIFYLEFRLRIRTCPRTQPWLTT